MSTRCPLRSNILPINQTRHSKNLCAGPLSKIPFGLIDSFYIMPGHYYYKITNDATITVEQRTGGGPHANQFLGDVHKGLSVFGTPWIRRFSCRWPAALGYPKWDNSGQDRGGISRCKSHISRPVDRSAD